MVLVVVGSRLVVVGSNVVVGGCSLVVVCISFVLVGSLVVVFVEARKYIQETF